MNLDWVFAICWSDDEINSTRSTPDSAVVSISPDATCRLPQPPP
jgi:hypothetical protein